MHMHARGIPEALSRPCFVAELLQLLCRSRARPTQSEAVDPAGVKNIRQLLAVLHARLSRTTRILARERRLLLVHDSLRAIAIKDHALLSASVAL